MMKNIFLKKLILNQIKSTSLSFSKSLPIANFAKKTRKPINPGIKPEIEKGLSEFDFIEDPSFASQKIFTGEFPFLPINDHPLIPGYSRFLPISLKLANALTDLSDKETEQTRVKVVVSVMKESQADTSLQIKNSLLENINFIPEISSSKAVFEVGCICEIQITEQRGNRNISLNCSLVNL